MAHFDLNNYETVEQRHARALEAHPDLRCEIINHTTADDRANKTWVVEARVYLNAADQSLGLFKASDWAFEIDGAGMANKTSALENASTSALGRALRWALAGSKGPSREEMEKVALGQRTDLPKEIRDAEIRKVGRPDPFADKKSEPQVTLSFVDYLAKLDELSTAEEIRQLYAEAKRVGAPKDVLDKIAAKGKTAK
jgi:hypothetical protein